jgi:cell division protein FtsX
MRVGAVGLTCLVAGLGIGAAAMVVVSGDDHGFAEGLATHEPATVDEQADRGGHVLVFLVEGVTDEQRQAIEAALARPDVEDYEYWDAEASLAEARQLFADDPEMLEKLDGGFHVPESYRLVLRDSDRPTATVVQGDLQGLPGVLQVVITSAVPELGG